MTLTLSTVVMPRCISRLSTLVTVAALLAYAPRPAGAQNPSRASSPTPTSPPAWLAGCWRQATTRNGVTRVVEEWWLPPSARTMMGLSRTVAADTLRAFEYLRIASFQGRLAYIAKPSRQDETPFQAVAITDTSAVFENEWHDYPQRIAYGKLPGDSLRAVISDLAEKRAFTYRFARVPCPR